jgi:eukaryotic-like serine/threonine-protein kinase
MTDNHTFMPIAAGTRLGPYEVVAPIGAGGMGEVWRGRDTRLDRSVAIKILPANFAENAQFKLRFEREAKAISQLNHPNICTLYDVGDSYIVMELLDGESLADKLAKGPLPLEQVLRYGNQIADALDKAHKQGIVHRDLKPGNVMITKSGAKLLDFGLAKSARGVIDGDGATEHKPLTQEGTILGTFQYMAPEQLEGSQADARTDIFALGTLLYEMATGRRAFEGKTKTSLIAAIVSSEPAPMSQIQPLMPAALEHVVRKCLAKDPEDRWQSAHDIAEELRWISEAGSQAGVATPLSIRRRTRERLAWAAAVVVALVAGIFAARSLHIGEAARPQYQFTIPMIDSGYKGGAQPHLSPDGRTVYFRATNGDGKFQVFRRSLDDLRATPIEGTEDVVGFLPTPDGRSLTLSFTGAVVKRISVNGGPVEMIVEGAPGAGTVSPDGTMLFGSDDRPVRRLLPNHMLDPITTVDTAHGETGHAWPLLLPDNKSFLFLSVSRDAERGTIRHVLCGATLGSKEITRIGEVSSRVEYAAGHLFFVREGTLMAQRFDASRFKFTGEPITIADNVGFSDRSGGAGFSAANDGTLVYQPFSPPHHLTIVDGSGKTLSVVSSTAAFASSPFGNNRFALLPDGSRVIIPVFDHRAGHTSLWVYGLNRQTATRLTFSSASEGNPAVTPDGSRVFFSSDAQSPLDIYEAPIDGGEPPKLRVAAANNQTVNGVSPDGRFLLYASNQNQTVTRQDLWILPLAPGGKPYPYLVTPAVENDGTFSPDGKWIAYDSDVTGTFQVYVRPFPGPGSARPVSTKGGRPVRFSRDGRRIYFVDGAKLMVADFHADGSTSEPTVAFELRDGISGFQLMPTGDRFLMLLQNEVDAAPAARVIVGWQPPKR